MKLVKKSSKKLFDEGVNVKMTTTPQLSPVISVSKLDS